MHKHLPMPYPTAEVWDWQLQGACRGHDSAVYFHPDGERGHARENRERNAKKVCATCPVLQQCRDTRTLRPRAVRHLGWNDGDRARRICAIAA